MSLHCILVCTVADKKFSVLCSVLCPVFVQCHPYLLHPQQLLKFSLYYSFSFFLSNLFIMHFGVLLYMSILLRLIEFLEFVVYTLHQVWKSFSHPFRESNYVCVIWFVIVLCSFLLSVLSLLASFWIVYVARSSISSLEVSRGSFSNIFYFFSYHVHIF